MNKEKSIETKEKFIPIIGMFLAGLFTIDMFFIYFYGIVQACGYPAFAIYQGIFFLLVFLHIFPGLILIPALLIIFIIQAIRFRADRKYIKKCIFSVLWCFIAFMTGYFINCISPDIEKMIINRKIQAYETVVDKIHSGEQISKYADMTGGTKGHEDVAFFQHSTGENEKADHTFYMTEYYILYSEDFSCDVERIKDHAEENPRYRCDAVEIQEIKENWYWLEAAYQLWP